MSCIDRYFISYVDITCSYEIDKIMQIIKNDKMTLKSVKKAKIEITKIILKNILEAKYKELSEYKKYLDEIKESERQIKYNIKSNKKELKSLQNM